MKIKKLLSALALVSILGVSMSNYVFAQDDFVNPFSENKEREQKVIEAILNGTELPPENEVQLPEVSLLWTCVDCNWFMPSVCAADGTVHDVFTHKYGLLKDKTCTETLLYSRGAYVCPTCYRVDMIDGEHWCWDVHRDCGKGQIDMCPMQES